MAIKIIKTRRPKTYTESVLDPAQPQLNPAIWESPEAIKPEVKEFILSEVKSFDIPDIKRIAFVGSNTGYQYTPTSDLDVHIWVPDLTKEQEDAYGKKLPTDLKLLDTEIPVQFYVIAVDESQGFTGKGAMWDLENDKWIVAPQKADIKVPISHLFAIAKFFMEGIDNRVMELESDEKELQHFQKYLEAETDEGQKKDIEARISYKQAEIVADFDALETAAEVLYGYRSDAYEGKKFDLDVDEVMGEGNQSTQAAVYKIIEELGYRQKIKDALKRKPGAQPAETPVAADEKPAEGEPK